MTTPGQPPAPVGQPPIIINNNVAASAAVVGGYGMVRRRRQSFGLHCVLLMLTCGIGNVFYAMHISRWNRNRGL
ncbi:hypothetical protein ACIO8G_37520 [Streptomyces sp. NPDC087219]|uniref:hypothetical protein n=1 Tax=unclassified Streptomyces TaxID=2593676 RepID=UPI00382FE935